MATRREDAAWDAFRRYVDLAQAELDGMVPVAMICLPARSVPDGEASDFMVDFERGARVIWPKDVPIDDRGPLLATIAETYRRGQVTR